MPRLDTTWPEECEFEDEVEDELSEGARRQLACVLLSSLVASSLVWFAWAMFLFATGHLSVRELDEEVCCVVFYTIHTRVGSVCVLTPPVDCV